MDRNIKLVILATCLVFTFNFTCSKNFTEFDRTEWQGKPFDTSSPVGNPTTCDGRCNGNPACFFWTWYDSSDPYNPQSCFQFNAVSGPLTNMHGTSGCKANNTSPFCKAGGGLCSDPNGFYPHETDCQKYYECSNGVPWEMSCPDELLWNQSEVTCDWPRNVDCTKGGQVIRIINLLTEDISGEITFRNSRQVLYSAKAGNSAAVQNPTNGQIVTIAAFIHDGSTPCLPFSGGSPPPTGGNFDVKPNGNSSAQADDNRSFPCKVVQE